MYGIRRGLGDTGCGDPVVVDGSPYITQCLTFDDANVYQISGAQVDGMAVKLYDPAGVKPSVSIQPTDNVLKVLQANNVPVQAADQGVSYEYGQLVKQNWTPEVSSGQTDPKQLESDVVQQMRAAGWTDEQLAPWINQLASYGLPVAGTATPAVQSTQTSNPAQSVAPSTYSLVAVDPTLASALSAPTGILTSPAVANPAATAATQTPSTPASSVGSQPAGTPAVSNNTLLIGGLAVVGILIMMSTGGKS